MHARPTVSASLPACSGKICICIDLPQHRRRTNTSGVRVESMWKAAADESVVVAGRQADRGDKQVSYPRPRERGGPNLGPHYILFYVLRGGPFRPCRGVLACSVRLTWVPFPSRVLCRPLPISLSPLFLSTSKKSKKSKKYLLKKESDNTYKVKEEVKETSI